MQLNKRYFGIFALFFIIFIPQIVLAEKIRDITNVVGVRDNQLLGYGLVIGLKGTGDKTSSKFTMQSISNMLESVNVKVAAGDITSKNVAAVMVTGKLPPFARQGDKVDVVISSIGDASSLDGGTLIMTPLTGVDGRIYATVQGGVSVATREGANPLSGSISGGGLIEREASYDLFSLTTITLSLKSANFQNATKVQNAINAHFKKPLAIAADPRTIRLTRENDMNMVEFLTIVEEIDIDYSSGSKIVVDERNGAIVAGTDIRVKPIVVTYGNITLKIANDEEVGENALDLGSGATLDRGKGLISSQEAPTVASVVRALQRMGATPKDVISILETIRRSGAITADIEII